MNEQNNNLNGVQNTQPQMNNLNSVPNVETQVNNVNVMPSVQPQMNDLGGMNNVQPQNQGVPVNNNPVPPMANPALQDFNNNMNQGYNNVQPNMNPQQGMQPVAPVQPAVNPMGTQPRKNKILLPLIIGIAVVAVVVVVLFVFVFGGKKTLVCTNSENSYGIQMDMEMTMNFKSNKIMSANGLITVDLGSYSSYKDTFIEQFEEEYADYETEGVDVNITSDETKVYVNISASRGNLDVMDIASAETYDEVKEELEAEGFTCK